MNEPSVEELMAAAERDETIARLLEGQLDALDRPGGSYRHRAGVELRAGDYSDDERGRAAFRADLARGRAEYFEARYRELSAAAVRRERYASDAGAGIERFTGEGRRSLDELLELARELRLARWEAARRNPDAEPSPAPSSRPRARRSP